MLQLLTGSSCSSSLEPFHQLIMDLRRHDGRCPVATFENESSSALPLFLPPSLQTDLKLSTVVEPSLPLFPSPDSNGSELSTANSPGKVALVPPTQSPRPRLSLSLSIDMAPKETTRVPNHAIHVHTPTHSFITIPSHTCGARPKQQTKKYSFSVTASSPAATKEGHISPSRKRQERLCPPVRTAPINWAQSGWQSCPPPPASVACVNLAHHGQSGAPVAAFGVAECQIQDVMSEAVSTWPHGDHDAGWILRIHVGTTRNWRRKCHI